MRAKSTSLRAALTTSRSAPSAPGGRVDHQVVDDPAVVVEQLGIALAARGETEQVGGTQRLEKARDRRVVGALDQRLAHMRNVEQPGGLAGVEVLGEDAGGYWIGMS